MKTWQDLIHQQTFRYLDQTMTTSFADKPFNALMSFAIDDSLIQSASAGHSPATIRLWCHPDTVILGIPDARLPYITAGVEFLKQQGFKSVIRNSGGLAVVLDDQVLNMSLILPDVKHLSIHDCYEAMVSLIQAMFSDLTNKIEAFEVVGSYCPGDFDLSIDGKKFAGISQRRVKNGAAIQIYLDIAGSGPKRAAMIRNFYQIGLKHEETKFTYPTIDPTTMASLSELLHINLTIDMVKQRVRKTIDTLTKQITTKQLSTMEMDVFHKRLKQMCKRNETIPH